MLKVANEPSQAAPASASATVTGGSDDGISPSTSRAPPKDASEPRQDPLGAIASAQVMDGKGAGKGANTERAEEEAVDERTAREAVTRDERQEGEGSRCGESEHHTPREERAQTTRLGNVAQPSHDGAADPLAGQVVARHVVRPPEEGSGHHQRAGGVEVERGARPGSGDHRAPDGRAHRAGKVRARSPARLGRSEPSRRRSER
jgi:hypothetical protein